MHDLPSCTQAIRHELWAFLYGTKNMWLEAWHQQFDRSLQYSCSFGFSLEKGAFNWLCIIRKRRSFWNIFPYFTCFLWLLRIHPVFPILGFTSAFKSSRNSMLFANWSLQLKNKLSHWAEVLITRNLTRYKKRIKDSAGSDDTASTINLVQRILTVEEGTQFLRREIQCQCWTLDMFHHRVYR